MHLLLDLLPSLLYTNAQNGILENGMYTLQYLPSSSIQIYGFLSNYLFIVYLLDRTSGSMLPATL
jgi:hypothetical protein